MRMLAALLAAAGIFSAAACGTFDPPAPKPTPPPAPAVFRVTGSAPTGVWMTYGSDSYSATTPSRTALPWRVKVPGAKMPRAMYYELNAQIHGESEGQIVCSITAHHVTQRVPASGANASCHVMIRLQGGHWAPEKP